VINSSGEVVIDPVYCEDMGDFVNSYASVSVVDEIAYGDFTPRWGLIDLEGNLVIDTKYYYLGEYSEGLVAFSDRKNIRGVNYVGYMKLDEEVIIGPQYISVSPFKNGIALVSPLSCIYKPSNTVAVENNCLIDKGNNRLYEFKKLTGFVFTDWQGDYIYVKDIENNKMGLIKIPDVNDQLTYKYSGIKKQS